MKLTKRIFLLSLALLILSTPMLFSRNIIMTKMASRRFLVRTSIVLIAAKNAVKEGKIYTGDLAKAAAHQKYSKLLFNKREFLRAVFHSRRARLLAILAIKANKGNNVPKEAELNKEEQLSNVPSDAELDKQLGTAEPNYEKSDETIIAKSDKEMENVE